MSTVTIQTIPSTTSSAKKELLQCARFGSWNAWRAQASGGARFTFEKMLGYAIHLGSYAQEIALHGEALGNFPQAFTHLGLISAATHLDSAINKPVVGPFEL